MDRILLDILPHEVWIGKRYGQSAKLLQDTGRLRKSFSPFYSRNTAGIGSSLSYSVAHEIGLPVRNLPARRMLPMTGDRSVERGVIKIYDRYIRRALR